MSKKVWVKSFGCQMNEYDSQKISDLMQAQGDWEPVENAEEADLVVLNTCAIREKAAEKVFSDLGRLRNLKQKNPDLRIGVSGCVATQEGAAILQRAPYVDVIFGPQTLHRLPNLLAQRESQARPQMDIAFPEIEKFDHLPAPQATGVSAFVTIMEGCSKYCSYCVVPYTRGEEISRPLTDVLAEVAALAQQGVKEVTLLGQNVNAYQGQLPDGSSADFTLLLEYVSELPQIERIRFTTSHPKEFSTRLIEAYGRLPKLASHVHLPVQHASDKILAAMKRGYSVLEYKSIIRRLRAIAPQINLTSDFIVGFPGETEADFEMLLAFVRELNFDSSFSFIYSPRPGTPAANLADDLSDSVKLARLHALQALLDEQEAAHNATLVGTVQQVLIEGQAKKSSAEMMGRCSNNRVVNLSVTPQSTLSVGQLCAVKITGALRHTLRGELMAG